MNLQATDFELFSLPPKFQQERADIDVRWKALQREAHPDKFAAQGAAAQRLAMQWSVRINEAYQRLKDPHKRAAYLCALHGVPLRADDNTAMPPSFLMQQMAWREAVDEGHSPVVEVAEAKQQAWEQVAARIDQHADYADAAQQLRMLMFIQKLEQDLTVHLQTQTQPPGRSGQ